MTFWRFGIILVKADFESAIHCNGMERSMRPNPKPQEMYRHFKGGVYQIRCLARHSETGETMVVYQAMYEPFQIYVRPLAMFMEEVDRAKYPDADQRYRFALLQAPDDAPETSGGVSAADDACGADARERARGGETPERREEASREAEELNIDPLVMEFLDADTYEQRLHILAELRDRVTDDMINTMAVAVDLEIKDGRIEDRYEELKNCLLTFERYECSRLR